MNMVKATYKPTEMNIKLHSLKGKTNLKFYQNVTNYYDQMLFRKFQFEDDTFSKDA